MYSRLSSMVMWEGWADLEERCRHGTGTLGLPLPFVDRGHAPQRASWRLLCTLKTEAGRGHLVRCSLRLNFAILADLQNKKS